MNKTTKNTIINVGLMTTRLGIGALIGRFTGALIGLVMPQDKKLVSKLATYAGGLLMAMFAGHAGDLFFDKYLPYKSIDEDDNEEEPVEEEEWHFPTE